MYCDSHVHAYQQYDAEIENQNHGIHAGSQGLPTDAYLQRKFELNAYESLWARLAIHCLSCKQAQKTHIMCRFHLPELSGMRDRLHPHKSPKSDASLEISTADIKSLTADTSSVVVDDMEETRLFIRMQLLQRTCKAGAHEKDCPSHGSATLFWPEKW